MREREIKALEDKLNYWSDNYDCSKVLECSTTYIERAYARYTVLLDLVLDMGLIYKEERVKKSLLSVEYTTTHYTLYNN